MRTQPLSEVDCDKEICNGLNLGYNSHGEYSPYFFNKFRVPIPIEGFYKNQSLFIFASGPSVKELDLKPLSKVPVMAINNSAITLLINGIIPTFWNCNDEPAQFVKEIWLNPLIQKFIPFDSFNKPLWDNTLWKSLDRKVQDMPNVLGYFRNEKFHAQRWFLERTLNWGLGKDIGDCRSTLLTAIKVAFILGFRNVYFLGLDFYMNKDKAYNFNERRSVTVTVMNNNNYETIAKEFLYPINEQGKKLGFNMYNCNPNSKMKAFPFEDYKKAIDKTLNSYYNISHKIESAGMYVPFDKKKIYDRATCVKIANGDI